MADDLEPENITNIKVLMSSDSMGGVWTYTLELIKGLQDFHVEFILAVMGKPLSNSQIHDLQKLKNVAVTQNSFKLEWMEDAWNDVNLSGQWLLELNNKYNPDIIHLNGYSHASLQWNRPVLVTGHSDVLSWYNEVKRSELPEIWNKYKSRVREGLSKADLIVAPSATMLNYIQQYYGRFNNAKVIYNGIDLEDYYIGWKRNIVFAMGRIWDEGKNISAMIQSAPFIKCPVYFAGEEKDPFGVNYLYHTNDNFLGIISRADVAAYLSEAAIFAHPAKYEPFGLSPLEAACSGCALVLGNIESLKEIWEDNALYVDPFDHEDISKKINQLIDDKYLRDSYAKKAFEHAKKYDFKNMSLQYYLTYKEMIETYSKTKKEIIATK